MKRMQVQDIVIRCRSVIPVIIEYVQGPAERSNVYWSPTLIGGSDLTAEVLHIYIRGNFLLLEVKPYGKE